MSVIAVSLFLHDTYFSRVIFIFTVFHLLFFYSLAKLSASLVSLSITIGIV